MEQNPLRHTNLKSYDGQCGERKDVSGGRRVQRRQGWRLRSGGMLRIVALEAGVR